jgi:hypothetical protein
MKAAQMALNIGLTPAGKSRFSGFAHEPFGVVAVCISNPAMRLGRQLYSDAEKSD